MNGKLGHEGTEYGLSILRLDPVRFLTVLLAGSIALPCEQAGNLTGEGYELGVLVELGDEVSGDVRERG